MRVATDFRGRASARLWVIPRKVVRGQGRQRPDSVVWCCFNDFSSTGLTRQVDFVGSVQPTVEHGKHATIHDSLAILELMV